MVEKALMTTVRMAEARDLEFVSQDGYLDPRVVERKIREGEVFVAERGGVPVGYIRIEFLWSILPYVGLVRVIEEHRRSGVGTAMLLHIEDVLRSAGHSALLSSSQVDEAEPQAWHRRMGFSECGVISAINEGGVGELFFRKEL